MGCATFHDGYELHGSGVVGVITSPKDRRGGFTVADPKAVLCSVEVNVETTDVKSVEEDTSTKLDWAS
jgi:hypothetical protein